jgi:hypothetical protein
MDHLCLCNVIGMYECDHSPQHSATALVPFIVAPGRDDQQ